MTRLRFALGLLIVVIAVGAFLAGRTVGRSTEAAATEPAPATSAGTPPVTSPGDTPPPRDEPTTTTTPSQPVIELRVPEEITPGEWAERLQALPTVTLPSDCGLPLDEAISLPNSERSYRGGTHQGIDFICLERGHEARSALPGRVVQANNSYVEPDPDDRNALLDEAQSLGYTPPWTLAMLYGRYVVLDHGVIPGAGHVVSVYAHFDEVDPAMVPGRYVEAGSVLGQIGNRGTDPAASGVDDPRSIHLHWELIIDDVYFGAGLGSSATRDLYADLFDA